MPTTGMPGCREARSCLSRPLAEVHVLGELGERVVEVLVDHDPVVARLAPARRLDRLEDGHGPTCPRDDNPLALFHALQQPREVRLGLMDVDGGHLRSMT